MAKLFPIRLSSFHSTFAEEGFREIFLETNVFFIVSRFWAKTRLLKKHQVECVNFILRVRRNFLRKTYFLKLFGIFFWYFERKKVTFEKNFRGIVKKAFNMSRGPSWWICFGWLKTYFSKCFRALSEKIFANFLGMFLEIASYVARGPFDFFSDFVMSYLIVFCNLSRRL